MPIPKAAALNREMKGDNLALRFEMASLQKPGDDIGIEAIRKELSYFEKVKGELLKTQKGKFALNELPRSLLRGI